MPGSRTPYRYFYLCNNPSRRAHPKQQNKRHGNYEGELTMCNNPKIHTLKIPTTKFFLKLPCVDECHVQKPNLRDALGLTPTSFITQAWHAIVNHVYLNTNK